MLAMPRLPAVRATVWPGRMRRPRSSCSRAEATAAADVLDARPLETLANPKPFAQMSC